MKLEKIIKSKYENEDIHRLLPSILFLKGEVTTKFNNIKAFDSYYLKGINLKIDQEGKNNYLVA